MKSLNSAEPGGRASRKGPHSVGRRAIADLSRRLIKNGPSPPKFMVDDDLCGWHLTIGVSCSAERRKPRRGKQIYSGPSESDGFIDWVPTARGDAWEDPGACRSVVAVRQAGRDLCCGWTDDLEAGSQNCRAVGRVYHRAAVKATSALTTESA